MSAVFCCPCGRKFLLQVSSLENRHAEAIPTVMATIAPNALVTQTVLPLERPPQEAASNAASPSPAAAENSSEQFTQGLSNLVASADAAVPVAAALSTVPVPQPAAAVADITPAASPPIFFLAPLYTFELYFTDQNGRAVRFWNVVRKYGTNIWRVASFARPALGFSRLEGIGLGGMPSRWHDFYPLRDPSEFGFDSDLAVLCWDELEGRAYAAEVELLQAALGDNWKAILRETRDQRAGIRGR